MRSCAGLFARRAGGFTLVEVIIAVVIMSLTSVTLSKLVSTVMRGSANMGENAQISIVAQQFIDEISLKSFDPIANPAISPTPPTCSRAAFNDLLDYNGYTSSGICDARGAAVPELAQYSVSVSVTAGAFNGAPTAKHIVVSVTGPTQSLTLGTWRVKAS